MGWFSAKKKVYVSSTTYNLAGDDSQRVDFLATTIFGNVVSGSKNSISTTVNSSLLAGPGIRTRSFARWARTSGYSEAVGLTATELSLGDSVDDVLLASLLPHSPNETVSIQSAFIDGAQYEAWVDQWLLANHPEQINEDFEIDFSELLNTIYLRKGDLLVYSFSPVGFNPGSRYLYANYTLSSYGGPQNVVPGLVTVVGSAGDFIDTTGWDLVSSYSVNNSETVSDTVTTAVSYSDGSPGSTTEVVTPVTLSYETTVSNYEETHYTGLTPATNSIDSLKSFLETRAGEGIVSSSTQTTTVEDIGSGVQKTTVVTTVTHVVGAAYSYKLDTQKIINTTWSNNQVLIYEYGTGNPTYDAMFAPNVTFGEFLPFIPVRTYNRTLGTGYEPDLYLKNIKAYKKAINNDYEDLVESVMENDDIDDVDFAYIVFGVSLNTKEKASLKYIFTFFEEILAQGGGGTGFDQWQADWNIAHLSVDAWVSWRNAQANPASPLFGSPEPVKLPYPAAPTKSIRLSSSTLNYDVTISWAVLETETVTGLGKAGAKQGDIWWTSQQMESVTFIAYMLTGQTIDFTINSFDGERLIWQISPTTYKVMRFRGLSHRNMVWKGKAVTTSGSSALWDPEVSSFIIPLQEGILKKVSLVTSTQMSMASTYIVFNSYEEVKQKWYQTGWFKVVLVIIVIVITVFTSGAGAGVGAGLLGTAAGVGAALGFSGALAIIIGTLVNALAAMIITQILTKAATLLFGEKVGAIVGAVASVVAISVGTSYMGGQGFAAGFTNLANAENIMKLSVAAGNGMSEYLNIKTADTLKEFEQVLADYETQSKIISDAYEENLGSSRVSLDPTLLTDAAKWSYIPESSEVFLNRTLLVGSDIALMTNELLANFTEITLSTELDAS